MKVGERVFNLQRLFNYRLKGWDVKNDTWTDKRIYEPAESGTFRGRKVPWDETLQEYYEYRGWTKNGIPTRGKTIELELGKEADELKLQD